ncbi:MAG: Non-specific serine/threonine protein kinase [Verrucomicrobiales bacterium]|nr:Non-specific serine/threonine protein kinase [Verrucomicrobiales bacterium]
MTNLVLPSSIADANDFLQSLDPNIRARGEAYFREGRVSDLARTDRVIRALVRGSEPDPYHVILTFNSRSEWVSACSCPMGGNCKHVYATMKALLAEHSVASVQNLSSKTTASTPTPKATRKKPVVPFPEQVANALDRPLKHDEQSFLQRLQQTYVNCQHFGRITPQDFEQMGLRLGGHRWEALKIWPEQPTSVHEFWLYVAQAAQQRGVHIPAFMLPVTDLKKIQTKFLRWQRNEEILRWKQALGTAMGSDSLPGKSVLHELRVRFTDRAAALEWKRPGQETFALMKKPEGRDFRLSWDEGSIELSPAAELLWKPFRKNLEIGRAAEIPYTESNSGAELGRLFRLQGFENLVVNPDGKPFELSQAPLRWHLDSAEDEEDNYRLRVALPDGSPLPPMLCVLQGNPTLYVTRNIIYHGPTASSGVIAPNRENVIPAPALETHAGATLLNALGVELPPRLQQRVRTIPLQIVVSCYLNTQERGFDEVCFVSATAQAPDGTIVESYNGRAWSAHEQKEEARSKKNNTITVYDRRALRDAGRLYSGLQTHWDGTPGGLFVPVTKKFPEQFAAWIKSLPPETKLDLKGELASFAQDAVAGKIRLEATESEIDWFDLKIVLDVADTTLSQEELGLLLDAKGGYVRLEGKGWRRVNFDLGSEEDEQLARLGLNPRELTSEPQRLHALQLADASAKRFLPEQQFDDIVRRAGEIKARVTPDQPASVQATLRPYQTEGFHFLAYLAENRFGGILADDMGLGKTLQTLTWLAWLRETKDSKAPSLVVCPKSVTDNWQAEGKRFTPGLRVKIWRGSDVNRFIKGLDEADLHVLNYSQLRSLGESLVPVRWLALILDEGQYIKNPSSQTAQVARALVAQHRLILSGTPIENRLLDLWSLMSFSMPGVLGSRGQFARTYDAKEDPFARRRLSARVRPFLLRRTKAQVAKDLPDRIEEDLFCEMEGEQKTLYRAELKRAQQMLLLIKTQKQLSQERFHLLTSLLRLRQISCHPRLVKPDSKAESAKVDALLEQLGPLMEEGHKVLIFSQFVEMLDILREQLEPLNHPLFYLSGATENRGELVERFQAAEGAAIFLISLKAGGFGLNLTAASYVVLFDPWWNPAVENQAIDRTHRIGQTRNVIAYRLLIKESIEEKIRMLQKTKSALADDVLGEEKFGQSLTLQDLQFLFSDDK